MADEVDPKDAMIAGLEAKLRTAEKSVKTLTGQVERADAGHATAVEQLKASHEAALATQKAQVEAAERAATAAGKETSFVRHRIDDSDARDIVEFKYSKIPVEERPEFRAYVDSLASEPPPWLKSYVEQQAAPPAPAPTPAPPTEGAAPAAATELPTGAPPPVAGDPPKTPAPTPPAHDAGAVPVGTAGDPTAGDILNMNDEAYANFRKAKGIG